MHNIVNTAPFVVKWSQGAVSKYGRSVFCSKEGRVCEPVRTPPRAAPAPGRSRLDARRDANPHHQQWQEAYRGRELKLVWYWLSIRTAGRHGKEARGWGWWDASKMSGAALPHGAMRGVASRRDAINLPAP